MLRVENPRHVPFSLCLSVLKRGTVCVLRRTPSLVTTKYTTVSVICQHISLCKEHPVDKYVYIEKCIYCLFQLFC